MSQTDRRGARSLLTHAHTRSGLALWSVLICLALLAVLLLWSGSLVGQAADEPVDPIERLGQRSADQRWKEARREWSTRRERRLQRNLTDSFKDDVAAPVVQQGDLPQSPAGSGSVMGQAFSMPPAQTTLAPTTLTPTTPVQTAPVVTAPVITAPATRTFPVPVPPVGQSRRSQSRGFLPLAERPNSERTHPERATPERATAERATTERATTERSIRQSAAAPFPLTMPVEEPQSNWVVAEDSSTDQPTARPEMAEGSARFGQRPAMDQFATHAPPSPRRIEAPGFTQGTPQPFAETTAVRDDWNGEKGMAPLPGKDQFVASQEVTAPTTGLARPMPEETEEMPAVAVAPAEPASPAVPEPVVASIPVEAPSVSPSASEPVLGLPTATDDSEAPLPPINVAELAPLPEPSLVPGEEPVASSVASNERVENRPRPQAVRVIRGRSPELAQKIAQQQIRHSVQSTPVDKTPDDVKALPVAVPSTLTERPVEASPKPASPVVLEPPVVASSEPVGEPASPAREQPGLPVASAIRPQVRVIRGRSPEAARKIAEDMAAREKAAGVMHQTNKPVAEQAAPLPESNFPVPPAREAMGTPAELTAQLPESSANRPLPTPSRTPPAPLTPAVQDRSRIVPRIGTPEPLPDDSPEPRHSPVLDSPPQLVPITSIMPFRSCSTDGSGVRMCPPGEGGEGSSDRCPDQQPLPVFGELERGFVEFNYCWDASNLHHNPLYFQDMSLERYGHSWCEPLQSVTSVARFGANLIALPYQVALSPVLKEEYPLGYYRPGDEAPHKVYQVPLNAKAAVKSAGVYTDMSFIVP